MARTSNFANIGATTRASKAWYDNWDAVSGSAPGALVEFATGVLRTGSLGTLIEGASTNHITNPRCEGATGSTFPTAWVNIGTGGLTRSMTVGQEDGWDYVDIAFSGTQSGASAFGFLSPLTLEAVQTDPYTLSVGMKIVAGSFSGDIKIGWYEYSSGPTTEATNLSSALAVDSTHRRFCHSSTVSDVDTTGIQPCIFLSNTAASVSFTLRVYAPQMENLSHPTSIVLPVVATPATSTRNADVASVPVGAWYSDEPFSIAFALTQRKAGSLEYAFSISDAAGQDYASFYISGSDSAQWFNAENGSITENKTIGTCAGVAAQTSVAIRQAANDLAASVNGSTQVTDATWTLPVDASTKMLIGCNPFGSSQLFGYVTSLRFWPRALTNAELDALVGN